VLPEVENPLEQSRGGPGSGGPGADIGGDTGGPGQASEKGSAGKGGNRRGGRQGGGFGRSSGPPEELNLTDDQKTKWTAASNKLRDTMREIFTSGVPREEMGAKMTELRDAFQEDLKAFLTEEQLVKYEEIRNQRPQGGRGSGGFGGGDRKGGGSGRSSGPPEELKLTDDQKTKWTAASTKQRDSMREIFTSGIPREEMGAKMTELREAFQADVKAFLTPEQQEKYKEIESQRSQRGSGGRGKRGGEGSGERPSGPGKGGPEKGN
jgi:Spy/CpxP family protein refolding chaperone